MTFLARVVFLALIGATFAAFFVAQELKSRPAVVEVGAQARFFSPNGDGRRDVNRLSVVVRKADDITVGVVDEDGDEIRRLENSVPARPFAPVRVTWDGRTDTGARAPDGLYRLRVGLRRQGRSVVVPRSMIVDTRPPRPLVRRASDQPSVVAPGDPVRFRVRGAGSRRAADVAVWRTDVVPAREVARVPTSPGRVRADWDGRVDGRPAEPGTYLAAARAWDRSGNAGSSAPGLPKLPAEVRGAPGVTVRALAVQLPPGPLRAGTRAQFLVDARGRPYVWSIRRAGATRPVRRGRSTQLRLRLRVPSGASGAYVLNLRAGDHRTAVPFLVQSRNRSPLLVVVPGITWLGREPADESGDGLPDTLERGKPVPLDRLLDGKPEGFDEELGPLFILLGRARVR